MQIFYPETVLFFVLLESDLFYNGAISSKDEFSIVSKVLRGILVFAARVFKDIFLNLQKKESLLWNLGKKYIIYPCALHRFYDELNVTHLFPGELKDPQKDKDFLVSHLIGGIISPLIAFKINSKQELSVIRFSEMNLKKQNNDIMSEIL